MAKHKMKIVQTILKILLIASLLFYFIGEVALPQENFWERSTFGEYQGTWERVLSDGTREKATVPGQYDTPKKEWLILETVLPQNQEKLTFCLRSLQQELKVYIDGELRTEYSTLETQPVGKTSTIAYLLFDVSEEDAGKTLRVEIMTDSHYTGYVSHVYIGEKSDIIRHFYGLYIPSLIMAALMLIISVIVICACVFVKIVYKREIEVVYLGMVILICSMWMVVESKIRQFLLPNSTVAMLMGFLLVALLPYPFLSYINCVQKQRYEKAYFALGVATIVNFVVSVTIQALEIRDFFEIMISSHIIIIILILLMTTTIIVDVCKGYVREYKEVAIGFAIVMACGLMEVALVYVIDTQFNGILLCIGLVALLFSSALKYIRELFNAEREKQRAISDGEMKAKFLANMSHEIRTPINTVIGMNEMILRENENEAIEEYAYNIKNASNMLLGIINDILDFSKIEAGKLQIVEADYYLSSILNDIIVGARIRAEEKYLEVNVEVDETLPSILKGDEIRIKQIANNLLSNAVKYTQEGSVSFSAKGVHDQNGFALEFKITDTGMGIKPEEKEKLFESFQRLELSQNRYIQGSGLGLNITKQLVTIMNGTIDVESQYGVGSCFTVRIPQTITDEKPIGKLKKNVEYQKAKTVQEKEVLHMPDAKILAVDDTYTNLLVIKGLLKRTQMQVDLAVSGTECLQMTKKTKYDLILMDHMMPEPDGIQTLHLLREDADNINQNTKVIVLTANAIAGMREQYLEEGFTDYLAKPVEAGELEALLKKYLTE